jgi:serine/threonine-protein kinase
MNMTPGTRVGPYEIQTPIGKGGMGEVYRARDTKLKREVAVKTLPDEFSHDADRVSRFQREAEVLASLNHPNIAAIYDFQEANGSWFLILELIEGETLAERIARGPIPVEQSLQIAKSICDALDAAHEKGIIHRDLKPANVKITPDGSVKVLDFGLAKVAETRADTRLSDSTTLTVAATQAGVILGTAAYMSPEQAQGKRLDKRTDIWSFGVLLYEMLTGKQPFHGETVADTVAGILKETPDLDRVPENIRPLLRKCLEKDRRQRLRDIGDAKVLLDYAPAAPVGARPWSWLVAAVASALVVITGIGWWRATQPSAQPMVRISAELSAVDRGRFRLDSTTVLAATQPGTHLALSPDGTRLATEVLDTDGQVRIAVRRLDEKTFTLLAGTETNPASPFFSPDGQWIGFFAGGKLRKIPVQGGSPITLSNSGVIASGSWGDDGSIIFAALGAQGVLSRVPSAGGEPARLTELAQGETAHRWPHVLPGSKAVLFTVYTGEETENTRIDVLSFRDHVRKTVVHGGVMGRYLVAPDSGGYLIYLRQNTLLAAPFDLDKLVVTATAKPVLDDVSSISLTSPGDFDFSRTGTLVYVGGSGDPPRSIFWLNSAGQTQPLHPAPGFYSGLRFSPDGTRLVFAVGGSDLLSHQDLWTQDPARKPSVRLTSLPGVSESPVWSPDGTHILFTSGNQANTGIYWVRADGADEPQLLVKTDPQVPLPIAFSPDGTRVIFESGNPFTAMDVWTAAFEGPSDQPKLGKREPLLRAPGFPMPAFSPDGHWLAYASGETGRNEIYVQPFPGPGGKVPISTDGGGFPEWSPNGRELFFLGLDRRIMVADYTIKGNSFLTGVPRLWSKQQILLHTTGGPFQPYAVAPDGKRVAVVLYPDGTAEHPNPLHLTFLLNFADELRRRVSP